MKYICIKNVDDVRIGDIIGDEKYQWLKNGYYFKKHYSNTVNGKFLEGKQRAIEHHFITLAEYRNIKIDEILKFYLK